MSEEAKKEETKAASQEKIRELTEEQLEETVGGTSTRDNKFKAPDGGFVHKKGFTDISSGLGSG